MIHDPKLVSLHVAGALALFASFGATLLGSTAGKAASALHGIALLLILLVGFAMLQKPPMDQQWWMVKLGLWLFLGIAPALAKRKVAPPAAIFGLCLVAATFAAWLGSAKPF